MENGISNETIIRTRDLNKSFAGITAVHDVNLDIPTGSVFGFIGPSVRLMLGIYTPDSGEVRVLQRSPQKFGRHERSQIGYMPQQFILYPELNVWENLSFAASLYGVPVRRKARLQDVMLRGQPPQILLLLALFVYAAILFLTGWFWLSRQMARE